MNRIIKASLIFLFFIFIVAVYIKWGNPDSNIIMNIRFQRLILTLFVGFVLAGIGNIYQMILNNPLAEPYILGISGGAAFGGALAILCGINFCGLGITLGAFGGALFSLLLLLGLIGFRREINIYFLLLAGVVLNALFSAAIFFMFALIKSEVLHSIYFWLFGDLSIVGFKEVIWLAFFVFFCGLGCFYYAYALDAIAQGEIVASSLGFSIDRIRMHLLIFVSLLVGATVAVTGMIGFVGLVTPHVMRMLTGNTHKTLLPFSFFAGGSFLTLSDVIARQIFAPLEMPVGVITAILGAPFFLYLLKCYVKVN